MQLFLADVSKIEGELTQLKADVAEIKKLQQNLLSNPTDPFRDKNDVTKHKSLGEQFRRDAAKIGASLKQLEKKHHSADPQDGSAFERIRTEQLNTLTTALNISTNEFFRIQGEYFEKSKRLIQRQAKIKGDNIDETRINAILSEESYSLFTDNYVADVYDAEKTLRDLEDRNKDILALEKSINEVNLLFKDLNLMISDQGDRVTTIENAVNKTGMDIEEGNKQLATAKQTKKKIRRRKCCIIITVLIVLVVVGIILAISLTR